MPNRLRPRRSIPALLGLITLFAVSASNASADDTVVCPPVMLQPPVVAQPPIRRQVFRPPFPVPRAKALYPGGYAGASYLPGRTSRPLSPTTYWTRPGRPFSAFLRP